MLLYLNDNEEELLKRALKDAIELNRRKMLMSSKPNDIKQIRIVESVYEDILRKVEDNAEGVYFPDIPTLMYAFLDLNIHTQDDILDQIDVINFHTRIESRRAMDMGKIIKALEKHHKLDDFSKLVYEAHGGCTIDKVAMQC